MVIAHIMPPGVHSVSLGFLEACFQQQRAAALIQ
jgi:hypothetical protein